MVPLSLLPVLLVKGGRDHPRVTSLLLHLLEGRATSLTLGDILYLADDDHLCQRLNRLSEVLECLFIDHGTGL